MALRGVITSLMILMPAVSAAETPLTGDEFDALTQGRTLFFYSDGQAYGAERYREGRRVTWTFLDGQCKEGRWYQDERFICFVYEDTPDPQCWTFFDAGTGLRALFEDRDGATELYEAGEAEEPLFCVGPEVGV
jgi:hypothetical protein